MKFCTACGNQLPQGALVCPNCGKRVAGVNPGGNPTPMNGSQPPMGGQPGMGGQPMGGQPAGMYARTRSRIDNIFSSLVYDKTTGSVMEFFLWCSVCLGVLLLFLAAVLTGDKEIDSKYTNGFQMMWIFMTLFTMGIGVVMVFRKLKPIMLFGAQIILQFVMFIVYYVTMMGRFSDIPDILDVRRLEVEGTVGAITLFILILMNAIAMIICSSIHFFSNVNLGRVIRVLTVLFSTLLFFFILVVYFSPYVERSDEKYQLFAGIKEHDIPNGWGFYGSCFWLGSIGFFIVSVAITIYTVLFFDGVIDNRNNKIYVISNAVGMQPNALRIPAIQCIKGTYPGQVFQLQNVEFSIGSQQGVNLVLPDPYISRTHCTVRFNPSSGMYEVRDLSTNGIYLMNGARLQKEVYTSLQRGTIICLGSTNQQLRLL